MHHSNRKYTSNTTKYNIHLKILRSVKKNIKRIVDIKILKQTFNEVKWASLNNF